MSTMTVEQVGKKIPQLARIGKVWQETAHTLALATLLHVQEHGDTRNILPLMDAVPKAGRREALATWFNDFSNGTLKVSRTEAGTYKVKLMSQRAPEDFDVTGAAAAPFYDYVPEPKAGKSLTMEQFLKRLKNTADNDECHDDGTPKVSSEARDLAGILYAAAVKATKPHLSAVKVTITETPAPSPDEDEDQDEAEAA